MDRAFIADVVPLEEKTVNASTAPLQIAKPLRTQLIAMRKRLCRSRMHATSGPTEY